MIKAIIVEDVPVHQETLKNLLLHTIVPFKVMAVCVDVATAAEAIDLYKPDLVFLDIELEFGDSGFDLLRRYKPPPFGVIFTTVHDNADNAVLALRAFALDFLSKPLEQPILDAAIERYLDIRGGTNADQVDTLIDYLDGEEIEYVWMRTSDGKTRIKINNIIYGESDDYTTTFHLLEPVAKTLHVLTTKRINEWEADLKHTSIMRVHRSFLANLNHWINYIPNKNGGGTMVMQNGGRVSVSRNGVAELRNMGKL